MFVFYKRQFFYTNNNKETNASISRRITMKRTALITALSLIVVSNMSIAGSKRPTCHNVTGQFTLTVDTNCPVLSAPERPYWYSDASFAYEVGVPQSCLKGQITGSLGGLNITANTYSAMTLNNFPGIENHLAFSAVSLVEVTTKEGWSLGKLVTKDTGIQDNTTLIANELLTITNGDGYFKNASGTVLIDGPSLIAPAEVTGSICLSR
jgi:hypothetical protein